MELAEFDKKNRAFLKLCNEPETSETGEAVEAVEAIETEKV